MKILPNTKVGKWHMPANRKSRVYYLQILRFKV